MSAKVLFFSLISIFSYYKSVKFFTLHSSLFTFFINFAAMKHIIGYDAKRLVRNTSGLGNYSRTLVNDLAATVPGDWSLRLYAPDEGREDLRRQIDPRPNVQYSYPKGDSSLFTLHSSLFTSLWRTRGIVSDLQRDHVTLYHGLSGELPLGIRKSGIPSVVTIHDLIFLRHPEYYKWLDRKIYTWKFHRTVKEADLIIAISECTRRDIIELGQVPADKIRVIYQSCSTLFKQREGDDHLMKVNARYELPARYLVNVGTIEPRKNIALAVKALPLLPDDLQLVIIGRRTPYADEVLQEARRLGVSHRVKLLHNVPTDDLPAILQMAEVSVYPSRYEGFGIPIIEAIQSGLPVVACTGSCLEEAGGPDSLYVSPDDPAAMAQAIRQSLKGAKGREERIRRSQTYVQRFEGTDVATQVLRLYQELLKSKT